MEVWSEGHISGPKEYLDTMVTNAKILIVVKSLLMILIIISNGMFLITLIKTASLHTVSNILLGALSLSDLLIGLVLEPMWIFQLVRLSQLRFDLRTFSTISFFSQALIGLSFIYMAIITCDRYLAICHPFKYLRYATKKLALAAPGLAFFLVAISALTATVAASAPVVTIAYVIDAIVSTTGFLLIIIWNCRIFIAVKKQKSQIMAMVNVMPAGNEKILRREKEKGWTNVVLVLLVVFLICYLPSTLVFHVLMQNHPWKLHSRLVTIVMWMDCLLCLNSLANPLLYCYRLRTIRRAIIETLNHMKRPFQDMISNCN